MKKFRVTVTFETEYFVEAEDEQNAADIAELLPFDGSNCSFCYVNAKDPTAITEITKAEEKENTFFNVWNLITEGIIDNPEDVKQ